MRIFKPKTKSTFLICGIILLVYSAALIGNNFQTQIEVRKATVAQMKQVLESEALAIGYFFSERKSDLRNLSQRRMLAAYFENLDLGMSLDYGLRFSLNSIADYLRTLVDENEVGNQKIYSRIVLIDTDGSLLADSSPQKQALQGTWPKIWNSISADHPVIFVEDELQVPQIVIAQPYKFKNRYAGQILAWLNPLIPYEYFISSPALAGDRVNLLLYGAGHLYFSGTADDWAVPFIRENCNKLETDTLKEYTIPDPQGKIHDVFISKIAIQGTPFFMVNVLRASSLLGSRSPVLLLVAMGLLTLVVLTVTGTLWRVNSKNLALQAGLREAARRKEEIEIKNALLQKEITERKETEQQNKKLAEQLLQAQKMEAIGTLAGGIAHDFNNILTAVLGFAEMAIIHGRDNYEMLASDLAGIIKAGKRAKELVRQILAFSRKGEHRREVLSPTPLIKESLKLLRASVPVSIDIREQIDGNCGYIFAEPSMIQQIVMNLCTNAVQSMEDEKGTITVRLTARLLSAEEINSEPGIAPGEFLELMVRDTGKGMSKAVLDRIFEPYFTTKDMSKGTGMGLALVHGIVQNCGGFIRVESEVGLGSTFRIFLPVAPQEKKAGAVAKVSESVLGGHEHILCIDDEADIVNIQAGLLGHLGYQVTSTTSAMEALDLLRAFPKRFDLVVTDQTMPQLTGLDFARQALAIRPDLPIILCSGYSAAISTNNIRAAGVRAFIMKPIQKKVLAGLVRSLLDGGTENGFNVLEA